jgi:hypothetical protein
VLFDAVISIKVFLAETPVAKARKGHCHQTLEGLFPKLLPVLSDPPEVIAGRASWVFDLVPIVSIQMKVHSNMPVYTILAAHKKETTETKKVNKAEVQTKGRVDQQSSIR